MKKYKEEIILEKEDIITFFKLEGQKPQIHIKYKGEKEDKRFKINFEDHDTFEYFALKLGRILTHTKNPKLIHRLDTARMKAIKLNQELNKIEVRL